MADYESHIIKPVEGSQNITGLAPARRREQRSRRQNLPGGNEDTKKQNPKEPANKQVSETPRKHWDENEDNSQNGRIDYQA